MLQTLYRNHFPKRSDDDCICSLTNRNFENAFDGSIYRRNERARRNKERGCAFTMYGWDGDQLAWESRQELGAGVGDHFQVIAGAARTTHYLYEPGSFVPLAQVVRR